jgi:drug/metabolite transporter (DMT)-like permease
MSAFMFIGGNGLINIAEKTVASGVASVLVATTPLFMALLETLVPWGERLRPRAWLGLLLGLAGVLVLFSGRFHGHEDAAHWVGPVLVLGSALCWSIGSFLHRHHRTSCPHLVVAGYQMLLGGASMTLVGVLVGEVGQVTAASFTPGAVFAFFYLLVVGSLMGFLTFVWLLRHVSAALAGTYAYVNPVVALFVGWLLAGEGLSLPVFGGMLVILTGVTLVRSAHKPAPPPPPVAAPARQPSLCEAPRESRMRTRKCHSGA